MANSGQHNIGTHIVDDLQKPVVRGMSAKTFQEIAGIKGIGGHFKWLAKQLEDSTSTIDCYISPFPSKTGLALGKFLDKTLPELRPVLTGTSDTQALRNSLMDVPALGMTAKNVIHGTTSFGMNQVQLLVKGEYVVFGAAAEFLPGQSLKDTHSLTHSKQKYFKTKTHTKHLRTRLMASSLEVGVRC